MAVLPGVLVFLARDAVSMTTDMAGEDRVRFGLLVNLAGVAGGTSTSLEIRKTSKKGGGELFSETLTGQCETLEL